MIRTAVLGATGYTGQELVRLLAQHPDVELKLVTTQQYGGENITDVFPHLKGTISMSCSENDIEAASACDVVFLALPHGVASQLVSSEVLSKTKVIDLGADFRLKDAGAYKKWYQILHGNESLLEQSTYGLTEWNHSAIATAQLVANPGCYATASSLALLPLLSQDIIDPATIIIDAKSGVSGAGRAATQAVHYNECNESIKAYGLATHRHTPEIEQQLSKYAPGTTITFTPHLVPMNRGILVTAYGSLKNPMTTAQALDVFEKQYADEPFVRVYKHDSAKSLPETRWVKGSNFCDIGCVVDERTGRLIVVAALDNLMKGASGQAVQNMNVMFGLDQRRGLTHVPLFPA
jgi:N-acetyl-gamma-glutamyl-phosphate reductase